ncbi:triose-phosphate isomerase family protein [Phytohabitans sp. ZYX-F-186]|uniref:Triosephosphate isomerase n=1 Tax=Phytohabitans maris TaxID=3071409 RepID=A0ABU0ZTU5_9ACTN|nr:triose-phosphate isomerase family protein [Phytohabitans sp. ZYX-F-186]MDQ7910373.1 triose-phosphate isomerase family protein [Phytohabitans sp. ZYX-F-186]
MLIGVSLKLYLDIPSTLDWCDRVLALLADRPAIVDGRVRVWVAPSLPAIPLVLDRVRGSALAVGAQDLFWAERGAFTGAVSGADLAALGCRYAVVGHAERRRLFGEDDAVVAAKTAAALRTGLTPVVCVGERERGPGAEQECRRQLDAAAPSGPAVVAYEPVWAIGAAEPAGVDRIAAVCAALRAKGNPVVYGGSAGPGLLTKLGGAVDGLFLGRFAHDPAALADVLDEAGALAS